MVLVIQKKKIRYNKVGGTSSSPDFSDATIYLGSLGNIGIFRQRLLEVIFSLVQCQIHRSNGFFVYASRPCLFQIQYLFGASVWRYDWRPSWCWAPLRIHDHNLANKPRRLFLIRLGASWLEDAYVYLSEAQVIALYAWICSTTNFKISNI